MEKLGFEPRQRDPLISELPCYFGSFPRRSDRRTQTANQVAVMQAGTVSIVQHQQQRQASSLPSSSQLSSSCHFRALLQFLCCILEPLEGSAGSQIWRESSQIATIWHLPGNSICCGPLHETSLQMPADEILNAPQPSACGP